MKNIDLSLFAWEQRKLEDYLEVSSEKNRDELFGKEDVLSVSGEVGIVNQIEFQGRSFAGASVANYGIVEVGDVVYTKSPLKSNPYGIIKTNKGKTGIVSTLYAVYKPKENVDSEFVQIYFESDFRMNSYMHPLVNKGAKNDMKVSDANALKGPVFFPKIEEQIAISQYFNSLDHLITLHQRKCEEMKTLKKYMLQKMFPQNGQSVPQIRFSGFTEDWEQRKLGEVCSEIGDGLHSAPEYDDNGNFYFINGNNLINGHIVINSKETKRVSEKTFEKNNKQLDDNTVLLSINGTIGNLAYYQGEPVMLGKSAAYLKANKIDKTFLYSLLQTTAVMNNFMLSLTGTTIKNLGLDAIKNTKISIPELHEQKKIGLYFSQLDNLITLHQQKCDELRNIKKFMLQNMFI